MAERICEYCEGTGETQVFYANGSSAPATLICRKCNGSGDIDHPNEKRAVTAKYRVKDA